MVTEGYSGKPPLPPTPGGLTSGSPRAHKSLRNLRCFLRVVLKKRRVLRCFVALGVAEMHLGTIKKLCVLRGFGVQGGSWNGKNDMLKVL